MVLYQKEKASAIFAGAFSVKGSPFPDEAYFPDS
jgi:hypothetical protein